MSDSFAVSDGPPPPEYTTLTGDPRAMRRSDSRKRWAVLILASLFVMSTYYCLDAPSALHDPLKRHFAKGYSSASFERYFSLMYSLYSMPNIILPLVGGVLIDRVGFRIMNLVFGIFVICGHILFSAGVEDTNMALVLAGRIIYGFGGECAVVGVSSMLAEWFRGTSEFAMVMGIKLSLGRLGSVLNNIVSRALYQSQNSVSFPAWFGVMVLCAAFCLYLVAFFIDRATEAQIDISRAQLRSWRAAGSPRLIDNIDEADAENGMISESHPPTVDDPDAPPPKDFHPRDILEFGRLYWLLVLSCVVIYGCIIPFNNVSSALIIERFICRGPCGSPKRQSSAETDASFIMGIPFIMTACLAPFLGVFVDKMGGNAALLVASASTLTFLHLMLAVSTDYTLLISMLVLLGLAYSIYAASIWPSVPATVEPHQVGTAFGLMTALQNAGLTVFPLIVAATRNEAGHYGAVEIFFCCLALLGTCCASYTAWYDHNHLNGLLNMSAAERNVELVRRAKALGRMGRAADEDVFGHEGDERSAAARLGGGEVLLVETSSDGDALLGPGRGRAGRGPARSEESTDDDDDDEEDGLGRGRGGVSSRRGGRARDGDDDDDEEPMFGGSALSNA